MAGRVARYALLLLCVAALLATAQSEYGSAQPGTSVARKLLADSRLSLGRQLLQQEDANSEVEAADVTQNTEGVRTPPPRMRKPST